jgi:hypothetical protein
MLRPRISRDLESIVSHIRPVLPPASAEVSSSIFHVLYDNDLFRLVSSGMGARRKLGRDLTKILSRSFENRETANIREEGDRCSNICGSQTYDLGCDEAEG